MLYDRKPECKSQWNKFSWNENNRMTIFLVGWCLIVSSGYDKCQITKHNTTREFTNKKQLNSVAYEVRC